MAIYSPNREIRTSEFTPSSQQGQRGLDPATGLPRAQPGSAEYELSYSAEHDMRLSDDERAAARARRESAERQTIEEAVAQAKKGRIPPGWALVSHPGGGSSNRAHPVSSSLMLALEGDLESLSSLGFARAPASELKRKQ